MKRNPVCNRKSARVRSHHLVGIVCALAMILSACSGSAAGNDRSSASGSRTVENQPLFALLDNDGRQVVGTADGFSLYIFDGDGLNESKCVEVCALTFIPLQPPAGGQSLIAGEGLDPNLISQFDREDGIVQVSYGGRALYRFSADVNPGDSAGEGSAGRWFLLAPDGSRIARG